jgi:hypothetical protein
MIVVAGWEGLLRSRKWYGGYELKFEPGASGEAKGRLEAGPFTKGQNAKGA